MKVHLQALGCRLNEAELQTWARKFHQEGHQISADPEAADLLVVNTCAVTQDAVRKSRKLLRRAQRLNPSARLVVTGCFATLEADGLQGEQGIDLLVSNPDKDDLVEIATKRLDLGCMPRGAMEPDTNPLFARSRQRAFVKVQDGCRYRCTFCVVTLARGEERSRPVAAVVDEINRLREEGVQEVVLTGVHLGGYGSDIQSNLAELIGAVLADTEIPRVRMGSVEPWDLPPGLWRLFENGRLMPHLHLPLQSGSDSVLRRMARRCRPQDFACLVREGRQQVTGLNLTTDIIVGFPGETELEWRETLAFVESVGFGHLHIFAYSPRPGTKAASLPDQVSSETKKLRSRQMHALGRRMKRESLGRLVGTRAPVLLEGRYAGSPEGDWFGYTPGYQPVRVPGSGREAQANQILEVGLAAVHLDAETLVGLPG